MDEHQSSLDLEIELLQSSLLAEEELQATDSPLPRTIDITSLASRLALHIAVEEGYPAASSVRIAVKGAQINRDEAEGWRAWVQERMIESYNEDDE